MSLECTTLHIGEWVYDPNVMCSCQKGEAVRERPRGRPSPNGYEGVRCVTLHIVERVYRPKRCVFLAEVEAAQGLPRGRPPLNGYVRVCSCVRSG